MNHIGEAHKLHHSRQKAGVIINCTGLSASKLGGVEDKTVIPARGQTVIVRNDPGVMVCTSGTDDGEEELLYIMRRAAGKISLYYSRHSFSCVTLTSFVQEEALSLAVLTS